MSEVPRRQVLAGHLAAAASKQAFSAKPVTEVDLRKIEPGRQVLVYWDYRPHFVRRRTPEQVVATRQIKLSTLQDPATDESRVKDPLWVVCEAVCTHAGCLPIHGQGEAGGWLCPCHGSEYDTCGRVTQGPALRNLAVPPYSFNGPDLLVIGQDKT
jgi:ubiquinol-cytochrome c reductase iron-sulfur subunit